MSGGHFDYDQYKILNMAEAIESVKIGRAHV